MSEPIIEEDYIMFETAKLAKEKGFGWEHRIIKSRRTGELVDQKSELFPEITIQPGVIASSHVEYCYDENGKVISPKLFNLKNSHYPRPTQALLQKWLRKIHNIHIEICLGHDYNNIWYDFYLYKIELGLQYEHLNQEVVSGSDTPEGALEEGLLIALKLIKS